MSSARKLGKRAGAGNLAEGVSAHPQIPCWEAITQPRATPLEPPFVMRSPLALFG